jgi:D-glycero-alpha-D-manno-heptose-7-phosphate kinase
LIAAFSKIKESLGHPLLPKRKLVLLAHAIEQGAAGVPCGRQDQLAAAFGGVNQWIWQPDNAGAPYRRRIIKRRSAHKALADRLMLAYCGRPHASRDINGQWVRQYLTGRFRNHWAEIVRCTDRFVQAMETDDLAVACEAMNRETVIRRELTPEVLDEMGAELVAAALDVGCGARFSGAGGGGCIWALGETEALARLGVRWKRLLSARTEARLLEFNIDAEGVKTDNLEEKGKNNEFSGCHHDAKQILGPEGMRSGSTL